MKTSTPTIAIVGVGAMGSATLEILLRKLPDARFVVLDREPAHVERAVALDPGRVAGSVGTVEAEGFAGLGASDLVINTAGPFYLGSDTLARAALGTGVPYLDISDDIAGTKAVLALDAEARAAGVPLLTGAGGSPGVSNLVAKHILETHPECDGIRVVWIACEDDPGGLAPLRHMLHMATHPAPVWREGSIVDAPGFVPQSAMEHEFPGLGTIRAFNTAHSEPLTLSREFPHLKQITVQGALLPNWVNDAMSILGRLGFADDELRIKVDGGGEIEPSTALWRLLWARHEKQHRGRSPRGISAVQVQGLVGDDAVVVMTYVDRENMMRTTGVGIAAAALAVLDETPPAGAHGVEVLDAERTLRTVEELWEAEGAVPDGLVAHQLTAPA
jgi:lysine 6-dehydrogenase